MSKSKKKDTDIKKLLSMSEIKGINVHNFISKKMREKLEKEYGKIFFPMLGIALDDKKQFIFLFHESIESIKKNKVFILNQQNFTEEDVKKFIEFIKEYTNGE